MVDKGHNYEGIYIDGNAKVQLGNTYTTTEVHPPPNRPETPPRPSSNIPFRRDPDFIARQTLLDQLHEKCSMPATRTALVGLGGVGKSQLAIEFSHQVRSQLPETWVFWVHASNAARFEQSFSEIADYVRIPGRKEPQADIFKLVHDWLQDDRNGKWFLVVDNADNAHWLLEPQSGKLPLSHGHDGSTKPIWKYLPQNQHGSVLVTTRNRRVALELVEERDIIPVDPMDEAHALALFERKILKYGETEDGLKLVAALEYMPLAIVQAAAYINQRAPRCSVQEYIEKFHKTDKSKTSLLNHEAGHHRRDWEAKNSIIITWQISFDHIQQARPSAADLLSLMSFFDHQGIPDGLLQNKDESSNMHSDTEHSDGHNKGHESKDSESETSDSETGITDEFEDNIQMLRNYSFITVNIHKTTFEMHRLVQLATRIWLEASGQLERWKQQSIKVLCTEFPEGQYENWAKCGVIFPHVQLALARQPKQDDSLKEWALLLYRAAWYAWLKGRVGDAEEMAVKSMKVRQKLLGQEHSDTLRSQAMVALAYALEGRWREAEELQVQVMEMCKRVVGIDCMDTLNNISNLATTYQNQERWKEAEDLRVQVTETRKGVLGAEHVDTLASISNLATTYWGQGRWKEAEDLGMQVMEAMKRVLGIEHPETLASIANLATTYQMQGRWTEAEELQVKTMEIYSRVLDQEHPDTLIIMNNLAWTWKSQNRGVEALELMSSCVELSKRKLGINHPETLARTQSYNTWRMEGSQFH